MLLSDLLQFSNLVVRTSNIRTGKITSTKTNRMFKRTMESNSLNPLRMILVNFYAIGVENQAIWHESAGTCLTLHLRRQA